MDHWNSIQSERLRRVMTTLGRGPLSSMVVFDQLQRAARGCGALDARIRELVTLGICVAAGREDRLPHRVRAARSAGATWPEITEVIGEAVRLGCGAVDRTA